MKQGETTAVACRQRRWGKKRSTDEGQPRGRKSAGRWRAVDKMLSLALWVMAVVYVMQVIVAVVMSWILGAEKMRETVWSAVYSAIFYVLAFLTILFLTPKILDLWAKIRQKPAKKHQIASREELGLAGLPTWTDIGLAPVGYIVAMVGAWGATALFELLPWFDAGQTQEILFSPYIFGFERVLAFLVLVVVAPIAEELIFRGWLYGKIREYLQGKFPKWAVLTLSILTVSLAFALMHGQWNVGVVVFILSVVMCGLREITGTIYAGILVHMLKNAIAFLMIFLMV